MGKKHINPLNTHFIEEMMILHVNIKNPLKFKSDDSITREDMKYHFSGLTRKINFIYLL